MFDEEFKRFGDFLQVDDFQQICMNKYMDYLETVVRFKGSKDDIEHVFEMYKGSLLKMIMRSNKLKDFIMTTDNRVIRHDLDLLDEVSFEKFAAGVLQGDDGLNFFESNARNIMTLEIAKIINCYGLDALEANHEQIGKEIELGIFDAKTDPFMSDEKRAQIEQRAGIYDTYGYEAIEYIENLELLKERVNKLRAFSSVPDEVAQIDEIIQSLNNVDAMLEQNNEGAIQLLEMCYAKYEEINRQMLSSRIKPLSGSVINSHDNGRFMLYHFIPQFDQSMDEEQHEFHEKDALGDYIDEVIRAKYGRHYDEKLDRAESFEIIRLFLKSKKNPFDLKSRLPLKNRYTNGDLVDVITKPRSNLSCSVGKVGGVKPHLERKIAIGFEAVPVSAIRTINSGYNNSLDRFTFEKNSVPVPEVIEFIERGGTNETLVDWTQVEPAYVMVVKDTEELSEDLIRQANMYARKNGLPVRVYDEYEIEQSKKMDVNR